MTQDTNLRTEDYTIVFGGDRKIVRSDAFINGTEGFIETLISIGSRTDPLVEVEYYIEAISEGSVRVHIKAIYKNANEIATNHIVGVILIGILVNWIYDVIKTDNSPQIVINDDSAIFEIGSQKIVVPKDAIKYYERLKGSQDIDRSIKKTFKAAQSDSDITYVGINYDNGSKSVILEIPRAEIEKLAKDDEVEEKTDSVRAEITIIRAILERSKRKWEFDWNGVKISSSITDDNFYKKFEGHEYQIAPGDRLVVELKIKRRRDKVSGVWEPISYEITSVWDVAQDIKGIQEKL